MTFVQTSYFLMDHVLAQLSYYKKERLLLPGFLAWPVFVVYVRGDNMGEGGMSVGIDERVGKTFTTRITVSRIISAV